MSTIRLNYFALALITLAGCNTNANDEGVRELYRTNSGFYKSKLNECLSKSAGRTPEQNRMLAAYMKTNLKNPIPLYCKRLIDGAKNGRLTSNDTRDLLSTGVPNAKVLAVIQGK
ncbi:hypothetical protein PMI41_01887 [Phyllobacterium sp. YR531]|nr:hypothetical protein PMI41_01887 [Phyllobacterium sp. YR531]